MKRSCVNNSMLFALVLSLKETNVTYQNLSDLSLIFLSLYKYQSTKQLSTIAKLSLCISTACTTKNCIHSLISLSYLSQISSTSPPTSPPTPGCIKNWRWRLNDAGHHSRRASPSIVEYCNFLLKSLCLFVHSF
jgi:hypothetical protein